MLGARVTGGAPHELDQGRHVLLGVFLVVKQELHGRFIARAELFHLLEAATGRGGGRQRGAGQERNQR